MTNLIFGSTTHARYHPKKHQFKYPLYMLEVDLKSLDSLNKISWLVGYNKKRLLSLHDSDYLDLGNGKISEKIKKIIQQVKIPEPIQSIKMVSIPRLLLNTFRPVSFYLCYSAENQLVSMIAEVTNTYKESCYYKLDHPKQSKRGQQFSIDKHFHVSPFFKEEGVYEFEVVEDEKSLGIHIHYRIENEAVFYADFIGKKEKLTHFSLMKLLMYYPLTSLLILPRIMVQAAKLYYQKKLTAYSKPKQTNKGVLRAMPLSWFQRKVIQKIESESHLFSKGNLQLSLPDQSQYKFGNGNPGYEAKLNVHNTWFFKSIQLGGEIGFGESYVRGEWDSPFVEDVIAFIIENKPQIHEKFEGSFWINSLNALKHYFRKNTQSQSKKNISEHYDLGNEFYKQFLDHTMMYSSALFQSESDTLEMAQKQKVDRLLNQLNLKKGMHVLEIGSGWGYVATQIAKNYHCHVTTVTLSEEQYKRTKELLKKEGVAHLVKVHLQDYREIEDHFDAIISIEMIEAVGASFLENYFDKCNKMLKKGGAVCTSNHYLSGQRLRKL